MWPTEDSSSFLPPQALIKLQTARNRKIGPIIRQINIDRSPAAKLASLNIFVSYDLVLNLHYVENTL